MCVGQYLGGTHAEKMELKEESGFTAPGEGLGKVDESFSSLLKSLARSFSWPRGLNPCLRTGRLSAGASQWKPDPLGSAPHFAAVEQR